MTIRYMLDTDISSYIVKGRPAEFRRRINDISLDQICVSAITQAELFYGLVRLPPEHRFHSGTADFLGSIVVLDWPATASAHFADAKHRLFSTGQRIGEMDLLIAAHARQAGLPLVTGNIRHHGRVPGLEIIDWRE